MKQLPNIDDILEGKEVEFESSSQLLFALIAGIIAKLKQSGSEAIENAIKFSFKLPSEFSVMLIKDMQQNGIEVESSEAFEDWVEKFAYLLE